VGSPAAQQVPVTVRLYGPFVIDGIRQATVFVRSVEEAIDALVANIPKLRDVFTSSKMCMLVDGELIDVDGIAKPRGFTSLDIVPPIGGQGPAIPIIIGIALKVGAVAIAQAIGGIITAQTIAQIGISMILSGLMSLLIKPPAAQKSAEPVDSRPSYNFNGAVNTTAQGNCVPVGYGRMRVGSQVISASIKTYDVALPPATPPTITSPIDSWLGEGYGYGP